ncbi:ATP-dependent DNA helicase [Trichonephila clavipes]|nr:ATP-dependent DNA helicase [Trichonephila clavipes]
MSNDILQPHVFSLMHWLPGAIFQQDITQAPTARVSQHCLRTVTTLPWPAGSPDFSPIKHIWDPLGWRVGHPTSLNELEARLQQDMQNLSQDMQNLYVSMPNRIASCTRARGGSTGIKCKRSIAIAIASSGIAATLIDGGIEALNRTLRDIRGCNQIIGGLTVLLSSDFRQTLPVVLRRTRADITKVGVDCSSWLKERAILTPINNSANNINNFLLSKLTTKHVKYDSVDSVMEAEEAVHYPVEFLNTLNPPGILPYILNLKIRALIMLLRNSNPPKLCKGTKLLMKNLHKNVIEATILTGKYEGEIVSIPRIPLIPLSYHFEFKRIQYPVPVCYAVTINKAQGQILKMAGIDLYKK